MLVIVVFGILALIAFPGLVRALARVEVAAARDAFASTHALARQVAAQYGRLSKLHVDPIDNKFWLTVDTSSRPGVEVEDTVRPIVLVGEQFAGVRIASNRRLLCFDPRGLGTAAGACNLPNATIVFSRAGAADTVTISRVGRLVKR